MNSWTNQEREIVAASSKAIHKTVNIAADAAGVSIPTDLFPSERREMLAIELERMKHLNELLLEYYVSTSGDAP